MSIFFVLEPRKSVVYPPPPSAAQIEAMLQALSEGDTVERAAAVSGIQPGLVTHIRHECRRVEPMVIEQLSQDLITTKTATVAYVQANTEDPFPATKFVNIMVANAGGTFAQLVVACKAEVA